MKAFLLAAGLGTRLRPLTDTIPKCLIDICGKPLLGWWIDLFERYEVNEVLINTHYLADSVRDYIEINNKKRKVILTETYETVLLGSGGTIRENKSFVRGEDNFLICYADNLTNVNLDKFMRFHRAKGGIFSMALFETNEPRQCGIAAVDESGMITEFEEKPNVPKSNLANAGIYMAGSSLFDYLPAAEILDLGNDVIPNLIGEMYGWKIDGYLRDVGTIDNYNLAQKEWKTLIGVEE